MDNLDRRALIQAKRARLEQLKQQRLQRQEQFQNENALDSLDNGLVDTIVKDVLTEKDTNQGQGNKPDKAPNGDSLAIHSDTPASQVVAVMYDKAVEVEEEDDFDPETIKARTRLAVEQELRAKYEQQLEQRIQELKTSQKHSVEASQDTLMKLLAVPIAPEAVNTDRESVYARPILSSGHSEGDGEFSASSADLVAHIITLDSGHNRPVTSLDWSPHFPELVLATYSYSKDSDGPRGLVIVWNTTTKRAEFTLFSHCELTLARFSKKQSNEVVAGAKNGRLYRWKFDSESRYPITSTAIGERTVSPIMQIYESSNTIVSVSMKGLVSIFSLDLVAKISEEQIALPDHKLFVMTACYLDATQLIAGLSTGEVYLCQLPHLNRDVSILRDTPQTLLPITSLDCQSGTVLAGSLDYKLHLIETNSHDDIIIQYPVAAVLLDKPNMISVAFDGRIEFWNDNHKPHAFIQCKNGDTFNVARKGTSLACGGLLGAVYIFADSP